EWLALPFRTPWTPFSLHTAQTDLQMMPSPGGENWQAHLFLTDPEYRGPPGLRTQSPPVLPVHAGLCGKTHSSNIILKFADDTTILGLISNNDETAYRDEVRGLAAWCQDNNLSLNVGKTKEMIVDFRELPRGGHEPIHIEGAAVDGHSHFTFLCVYIKDDLTWSMQADSSQNCPKVAILLEETQEVWHVC